MGGNNAVDYDIVIVGGGMVGASLAHALKPTGFRLGLVEAVPRKADQQPSYDDRNLALSPSSRRILAELGALGDELLGDKVGVGAFVGDAEDQALLAVHESHAVSPWCDCVGVGCGCGS